MMLLIYGILKNDTNQLVYKTEKNYRQRKQTYVYQWGKGRNNKLEVWH